MAEVEVGFIIDSTVEQLEITAPVIFPAFRQVVVAEVGVVHEVVVASVGIEAVAHSHVQITQSYNLLLPLGVKFPTLILEIRLQYILDTTLVIHRDHRSSVIPGTELQFDGWCKASVLGGLVVFRHHLFVHRGTFVVNQTRFHIKPVE